MKFQKFFLLILLTATAVFSVAAQSSSAESSGEKTLSPRQKKPHPLHKGRAFHRRHHPRNSFFAKFTQEERGKIRELAQAGKREELRKYMGSLIYKYRPEELKKMEELGIRYRSAKEEKEKLALTAQMRALSEKLFRKRQEFTHNNILYTEKQLQRAKLELERLKKLYEHCQKNRAKIIEQQVENMCLPPEQRKKIWKKNLRKTGKAENRKP